MAIKYYKPNRAARSAKKNMSIVDRSHLYKGDPYRPLTTSKLGVNGRGSFGKITIRHRGGGVKRLFRVIEFGQAKMGVEARVERLEFDPNRSSFIALLLYADGDRRYVLAWQGIKVGNKVITDEKAKETNGNRMMIKNITPGATVYNVELRPGRGGSLFRSAGSYGILMDVKSGKAQLKLPSNEIRLVPDDAFATIGAVSNPDHRLVKIGSAGRKRRMGRRPQVRGKVMNPNDHPHGGGEGAQPIGLKYPKTPWGKIAIGGKTRSKNKYSDAMIIQRRLKKRKK